MTSKIIVNTIEADTGISSVTFASNINLQNDSSVLVSSSGVRLGTGSTIAAPSATLSTNSAERVRLTSAGNLGIGNNAPDAPLRVTSSAVSEASQANDIAVFERNDNGYLKVYTPNNKKGGIVFGDPDSPFVGATLYDHSSNKLEFWTGSSPHMYVNSSGNLGIGDASPTKPLTVGTTTPVILLDDQSSRTLEIRGPSTTHNATVLTTSTHDLLLGTNNAERLRITSAGDMGLGTASPRSITNFGSFAINGTAGAFTDYFLNGTRTGTTAVDSNGFTSEAVGSSTPFRVITNGSERLRIHSSGVPQFTTTGTQYASASVPAFVVNSNGDHALVLNNQNTTDPRGLFIYQDQDVNNGTSYFLRARAGGTDRAHLYSNGTLQLHSGNLKLASGNGIDFSATGGPGSMTSELLDDYEEGTFTPTETSGANLTLTTAAGLYTKIGRMVHIQVRVKYPSTSNTNHARIGGFPFTPSIYGSNISNGANASGFGYYTGSFIPQLHMNQSQTYTNFYNFSTIVTNANFSARELRFGIVYSAA